MNARSCILTACVATLLVFGVSSIATAQSSDLGGGSCLVFPYFDSSPGAGTLITITNREDLTQYCPERDVRGGDVSLHFVYINGTTGDEYDTYEYLTPGDTTTYVVDRHNPTLGEGWLVVTAWEPQARQWGHAVDFDHLVGSAIVVESALDFLWSYQAYAFTATPESDPCEFLPTDADGDGAADFDGVEYARFPSEIFVDAFFEEGPTISNQLTLVSTADRAHTSEIRLWIHNNDDRSYSASTELGSSFWTGPLSDLSYAATDLRGDTERDPGPVEIGWVSLEGGRILDRAGNVVRAESGAPAKAPILGVFAQYATGVGLTLGQTLHHRGSLDGLEFFVGNGDPQQ